jgi:hypothetical protein
LPSPASRLAPWTSQGVQLILLFTIFIQLIFCFIVLHLPLYITIPQLFYTIFYHAEFFGSSRFMGKQWPYPARPNETKLR